MSVLNEGNGVFVVPFCEEEMPEDSEATAILAKIRQLGGEATARMLKDCFARYHRKGGVEALDGDPFKVLAYQFDVVINGVELASGAVRNHSNEIMVKAFEIAGYSEAELESRFGALYGAFKFGAPPHAGMAYGIDRLLMLMLGEANVREVIAFPLNGNAQDTLLGAPSEVTEQQLREVHIKVRDKH